MKFLVAVDGSEEAERAIAYAADIADAMDRPITIVHAIDPNVYEEGGSDPISSLADADQRLVLESVEDAERRAMDLLENAGELADEFGADAETELLYGDPVTTIADYAEDGEFDGVFVGHRGRSERTDLMIGSVAKALVERASVPVTVVR
ncbi:universal stress protein UspA [Natronococcus pandeyae]|uniref:Universal stress protein UspA n=1 Tax=Natronococcus pandeyae TaxID=2055836 RepID=A0A8J8Q002_9EURY|nr:universal stress protein [Natronococcus pandeyae]TYL36507.1 universal stress protein UspA [Natronococcus pandeyae]